MPERQPSLFRNTAGGLSVAMQTVEFHGSDLQKSDVPRLGRQLRAVFDVMSDGQWWTTEAVYNIVCEMHPHTKWKMTSIDRQIRYLKDIPGCTVEIESRGDGLFVHRLIREESNQ